MDICSMIALKAKLFRGLGDPSRLAIIETLRSGEKTVSEIVAATELSQPNASAHLSCLKDCGLLRSRQEGRKVFYALTSNHMESLIKAADSILCEVTERIAFCSKYECKSEKKCTNNNKCSSPLAVLPTARKRQSTLSSIEDSKN